MWLPMAESRPIAHSALMFESKQLLGKTMGEIIMNELCTRSKQHNNNW